jgi:tetratricopeptide (TPR) repeat protein
MRKAKPSKRRGGSVQHTDEKLRAALHDNTGGVYLGDAALGCAAEMRIVSSIPATPPFTPGVSLTMIVKNEESNIAACLESVRDLVDEIIVVDTGSNDATKSIAAGFGAKVFDFQWVDDFAAARNESLRHATREWIFWMDADDRLDEENRGKLRAFFGQLPQANVAYRMKCVSLLNNGTTTVNIQPRLFRNDPRIRWKCRCHEQIDSAVLESGGEVRGSDSGSIFNRPSVQKREGTAACFNGPDGSDIVVTHIGYLNLQHVLLKLRRNLRLLQLDNRDHPNDWYTLYNLGKTLSSMGQPGEALPYLQKSLALSDFQCVGQYMSIALCYAQLGQSEQVLQAYREGLRAFPNDPHLLYGEEMLLTRMSFR